MTGGSKARDAVLILAVLGLGALALLPGRAPGPALGSGAEGGGAGATGQDAGVVRSDGPDRDAGPGSSPPAREDVSHGLLPLVPGSEWTYRVTGPADLVPAGTWVLRLISAPSGEEPGTAETGFGEAREQGQVRLGTDWLFVDTLPLLEPAQFAGNRPRRLSGTLLPAPGGLVERAAWDLRMERRVTHTIRDELERPVTRKMRAVQIDRAVVEGFEEIAVPAGEYRAGRVEWTSSLDLFAGGRQVFDALTLEPFRSETMWIAPGVGIVKRQIRWTGSPVRAVTFQLERYHRPGP